VVELHHNDRSPTRCGGAPPHLLSVSSGCCSHSVRKLWWSSTTVCCCSQQFLLLRSSSTTGIADSWCCVVAELCHNANAPCTCKQNTQQTLLLCCILQPSVAGELPSSARLQNAAVSEQHSTEKRTCLPAVAPLALLPLGWGSLHANRKLAKSSLSIFCFRIKNQCSS
jgi:hypothetical protein